MVVSAGMAHIRINTIRAGSKLLLVLPIQIQSCISTKDQINSNCNSVLYLYDRLDQRRFDVMTRVPV